MNLRGTSLCLATIDPGCFVANALGLYRPSSGQSCDADAKKPNILVIWGDRHRHMELSHNNRGMMGYKTPTLIASLPRESPSRTTTANRVAPLAEPPSSAEAFPYALA